MCPRHGLRRVPLLQFLGPRSTWTSYSQRDSVERLPGVLSRGGFRTWRTDNGRHDSRSWTQQTHTVLNIKQLPQKVTLDYDSCPQRWKWIIFRDPWPMWPITQLTHDPHDPWPMAITSFHPTHGTKMGRGIVVLATLSVLRANKIVDQNWPRTMILGLEWMSIFLKTTKNKKLQATA